MRVRKLRKVDEHGPLAATRTFLRAVWEGAELDGMLLPIWTEGANLPEYHQVLDPKLVVQADPFSPLNIKNSARWALDQILDSQERKLGLILRPCEQNCFTELLSRQAETIPAYLSIGVDCLASYPTEDIDWRVDSVENPEQITLEVLHFAAQGGLLPNRYRQSCQCCDNPTPGEADIQIEVLGLQTQNHLVVGFASEELAESVKAVDEGWGMIPTVINQRRMRVLKNIQNWRKQSYAYAIGKLEDRYKEFDTLLDHLTNCPDCRQRLNEDCSLVDLGLGPSFSPREVQQLKDQLASCAACGMCEYVCPQGFPLFNVVRYLASQVKA